MENKTIRVTKRNKWNKTSKLRSVKAAGRGYLESREEDEYREMDWNMKAEIQI